MSPWDVLCRGSLSQVVDGLTSPFLPFPVVGSSLGVTTMIVIPIAYSLHGRPSSFTMHAHVLSQLVSPGLLDTPLPEISAMRPVYPVPSNFPECVTRDLFALEPPQSASGAFGRRSGKWLSPSFEESSGS